MKHSKKRGIATNDSWLPLSLPFLRSRACAQLSPHASKLLLELLGLLSTNANRNGDLSLAPKVMKCRGWSGRATLAAAVRELVDANLLFQTRQGGRKDCSLWALTLYPISCDLKKIDVTPGCYYTSAYAGEDRWLEKPPTADKPVVWQRVRKTVQHDPLGNKAAPT